MKIKQKSISQAFVISLLSIGLTACGGGGGGGTDPGPGPEPEPPEPVPTVAYPSTAVKGPLSNTTITATDAAGTEQASFTADLSSFSLDLPENAVFPVTVTTSGGTDSFTGQDVGTLELSLSGYVLNSDQITVNINPMSTLMVELIGFLGDLDQDNVDIAQRIFRNYGFGLPVGFNPATSLMTRQSAPQVLLAFESFFESVRRTANATDSTPNEVITALAADLVDGILDGQGAAGTSPLISSSFNAEGAIVLLETLSGELTIDAGGANETVLTAEQINAGTESITGEAGESTMAALAPTSQLITQTSRMVRVALATTEDQDEIDSLTALQNQIESVPGDQSATESSTTQIRTARQAAAPALQAVATKSREDTGVQASNAVATTTFAEDEDNAFPAPVDDLFMVSAGESASLDVLSNDPEVVDGFGGLTVAQPAHGTVSVNADDTLAYTADSDFFGLDSFSYVVFDSDGDEGGATVTLEVNIAPVANDDSANAAGTTPVEIAVQDNDERLQETPITLTIGTTPTNGTATVSGAAITYTANDGFTGTDTFTYQIADDSGDSATATVTVNVLDTTTPVANADAAETAVGESVDIEVLANDSQLDDTPITLSVADAANGTVEVIEQIARYTPDAGFAGSDSFEYTVTDNGGQSGTATVTVFVDDTPEAADRSFEIDAGQSASIDLLEGATGTGNTPLSFALVQAPNNGTALLEGTSLTYTPKSGFGGFDTLRVRLRDSDGDIAIATLTIFVDRAPAAENDAFEFTSGNFGPLDVLANDERGNSPVTVEVLAGSTGGTYAVDADRAVEFTAGSGFTGSAAFSYRITDSDGDTSEAQVTLFVDEQPEANNDTVDAPADAPVTIDVLDNDSGLLNAPLSVSISGGSNGTGSVSGTAVTWTPAAGFGGDESFQYTVTDADGDSSTATVSIFFDATPVAVDDNLATPLETAINADLLGNDLGLGNGPISVELTGETQGGTATLDGSVLTYTPDAGFAGVENFGYQITDADGDTAEASIMITVDNRPILIDQDLVSPVNTPITVDVLAGAAGLSDVPLTIEIIDAPTNGEATLVDSLLTYAPATDFGSTDTITVRVTDSDGDAGTASISIFMNDTPVAADDDGLTTPIDTPLNGINVLANDQGLLNEPLMLEVPADAIEGGTVNVNADFSVDFTPDSGFAGDASFTYVVTDFDGEFSDAVVSIFVDDTPEAADDSAEVPANSTEAIDILANDTGLGNEPVTVDIISAPAGGDATFDGDVLTYSTSDFGGSDSLTYRITDSDGDTTEATLSIFVEDTPVASDDALEAPADTPAVIDVLANDAGLLNTPLTITLSGGANGSGTVADGQVIWTPATGFGGNDSFEYTITDADGDTTSATVSIFFDATPVAVDDQAQTPISTATDVAVLANDLGLGNAPITVELTSSPATGTATLTDGIISYTPEDDFSGNVTIGYRITDADGDTAEATVTISVDSQPELVDQSATTQVETPISIGAFVGGTGLNDAPLTVDVIEGPGHGTTVVAGSLVTYTPEAGFGGTDELTVRVTDVDGDTSEAVISVFVNDTPSAVDDPDFETPVDTALTGMDVLANDGGLLNEPLMVELVAGTSSGGTFTVNPDFTLDFTPDAGHTGDASVSYRVTDFDGEFSEATATVFVDDIPVANDDDKDINTGNNRLIDVLANDSGLGNEPITVDIISAPSGGSASFNGSQVAYSSNSGFGGDDEFTYRITDADGDTAEATVTLFVDDIPSASFDFRVTTKNNPVTIDVLADDSGLGNGIASLTITSPSNGTASVTSDNRVTYSPIGNFLGTDEFTYTITDTDGDSSSATVRVFVDDRPVAVDDSVVLNSGTTSNVNVLSNDGGLGDTPVSVSIISAPANGTATVSGGTISYTPDIGFNGNDQLNYRVTDADGDSDIGTLFIVIDDTPALVDQPSLVTPLNTPLVVNLIAGATGVSNTPLTASITSGVSNGTTSVSGTNVTYTPSMNFASSDTFTYTITDVDGDVDTATVTIFVNDTPVANDDPGLSTPVNSTLSNIDILGNDTGLLNTPISLSFANEVGGTVTQNMDNTVNFATAGFASTSPTNGGFDYTITDSNGDTATGTVTIFVDDAPSATADSVSTPVSTPVDIDVLANDVGIGNTPLTVTITTPSANGTAVVNGDNSVTFTPNGGFANTTTFQYTVTDADGDTSIGTTSVFVDDTPVANDDPAMGILQTAVNTTLTNIDVLGNDTGLGNTPLSLFIDAETGGTATVNGDNTINFAPTTDTAGDATFTYRIVDGDTTGAEESTANVTIDVNDTPVAVDDSAGTPLDTPVLIDVTANDTGLLDGIQSVQITTPADPAKAASVVVTGNDITYTPQNGLMPTTDTFGYTVTDNDGETSNEATVTVGIGFAATDDTVDIIENTVDATAILGTEERVIQVLQNDALGPPPDAIITAVTQGTGTVTFNDTSITYTPPAGPAGGSDSFTYTITNSTLGEDRTATVNVTMVSICTLDNVNCVNTAPDAFTTIQAAVDASGPGDWVKIPGGVYNHDINDLAVPKSLMNIEVSGTAGNPIRIEPFDGESVELRGWRQTANGWSDCSSINATDPANVILSADCDSNGDALQDAPAVTDEVVVRVAADYIELRNVLISDATRFCLEVIGSHNTFENIEIKDCYYDNISAGLRTPSGPLVGNTFRHIESHHSRHGAGMIMSAPHPGPGVFNFMYNNVVEDSIFYSNGYQPDGQLVPEAPGDPVAVSNPASRVDPEDGLGGGNSDGFVVSKVCEDDKDQITPLQLGDGTPVKALCPFNRLSGVVAFDNADDGIDTTWGESTNEDNISFTNGPQGERGYKILRQTVTDLTYIGNIAMDQEGPAYEIRMSQKGAMYHNLAINSPGNRGFGISLNQDDMLELTTPTDFPIYNNVGAFVTGFDLVLEGKGGLMVLPDLGAEAYNDADEINNWVTDSGLDVGAPNVGDPMFVDNTFSAGDVDKNFTGMTIAEKVQHIVDQFKAAFTPDTGSPLIDGGVIIPGLHCATADDDPVTPHDPNDETCRHWAGAAPDIGPFESGL